MAKDLNYTLSLKDLFSKRMQGAVNETSKLDSKMNSTARLAGGLAIKIAGMFAVGGIVGFGKAIFNSLDNYQQFSVGLRTMMRGDALASKALEGQLISLARTTPFELKDVQDATKKLMAFGVTGGEMTQTIRMLGDVSAGLGKESFPFIIRAFGQIKSKGHLAGQELNQLTEQGFNPLNIIAQKTGKSYDYLLKEMERGKITFKEVEQAFRDVTKEGGQFFNMMDAQSKTVGGKWSNIADVWEQIKVNIGNSQTGIINGTLDFISKMGTTLNDKLSAGNFMDEAFKASGAQGYSSMTAMYGNLRGLKDIKSLSGNFPEMKDKAMYMQSLIEQSTTGEKSKQNLAYIALNKEKLSEKYKNKEIDPINFTREMSLYNAAYRGIIGNLGLLKSKADKTLMPYDENGKLSSIPKSSISSGVNITAQRPQSLVINITKLVENLNLTSQNLTEGVGKIREEVSKMFLEMVNDANLVLTK